MPTGNAGKKKPRSSKINKAAKTEKSASFFVAPTTPFIPVQSRSAAFSVNAEPGLPSPHLVDLRTVTAARPYRRLKQAGGAGRAGLSAVSVPRTFSQRPETQRVWNQLALVAFGRFLFSLVKLLVLGAGHLLIAPLTLGLKIVDHLDPDRPLPLEAEISNSSVKAKEAVPSAPVAVKPEAPKPRLKKPFNLRRALVSFAGTSLAIILPLQGFNALRTIETIRAQAQNAKDVSLAALNGASSFADAQAAILETRRTIDDLGQVANALLERAPRVGGMFRSGKALLDAGSDLATAAGLLSRSLDSIADPSLGVTDKIAEAQNLAEQSEPLLLSAKNALDGAEALPEGVSGDLATIRQNVADLENLTSSFLSVAPALRGILGERQARRYLVIFQNNAELRPTGGFIGSFAVIDVDRGEIKSVNVPAGGSYDLQGSLKASVLSPDPLRLVRAKWEFQDANWFPDFPTSAQKLTWFYNQSSGPSVDGVISVNAPVLAALLDAVGPINMPAYGTVATGTTVLQTAQQIVESPSARESGKPKQFIADLLPLALQRIMDASGEEATRTVSVFAKALESKDIQMYFADQDAELAFSRLGWTGGLAAIPEGFDSLELVRANIAGGKTDPVIKTDIRHESVIGEDGQVTDHVTVSLEHQGRKGDPFTGVRNVTYLRLYVPEGSRLIRASGDIRPPAPSFFDLPSEGCGPDQTLTDVSGPVLHDPNSGTAVNNELGRTVFGVWTQTDPGTTSTVVFDYQLPFSVSPTAEAPDIRQRLGLSSAPIAQAPFGLVIEKQSGAENTAISSSLKIPKGWYPSFAVPEGIANEDGWSYTTKLDEDKVIGMMIAK